MRGHPALAFFLPASEPPLAESFPINEKVNGNLGCHDDTEPILQPIIRTSGHVDMEQFSGCCVRSFVQLHWMSSVFLNLSVQPQRVPCSERTGNEECRRSAEYPPGGIVPIGRWVYGAGKLVVTGLSMGIGMKSHLVDS